MTTANGNGLVRWVLGLAVGIALSLAGGAFGYTQARVAKLEDTCVTQREILPQLDTMRRDIAEIKQMLRDRSKPQR